MSSAALDSWIPGPGAPALQSGGVHVWRADLDADGPDVDLLSADERERAERILDPDRRRRWTASRATLRTLLGRHVGCEPGELGFELGSHGKPALRAPAGASVAFSLSHSGALAVYAVSATGEVGIDVERADRPFDEDALRRRLGTGLAPSVGRRELLRAWTRREAVLKCLGVGLAGPAAPSDMGRPAVIDVDVGVGAVCAVAGAEVSTLFGQHHRGELLGLCHGEDVGVRCRDPVA